jgi:hypothetical protein
VYAAAFGLACIGVETTFVLRRALKIVRQQD